MNPAVFSLIMPTFNSGTTIERALNSMLHQTFKDIEILIMDGSSSDNTTHLVQQYAYTDSRIKWVSEKDNGVYDAMNKGIQKANGEWLYFLGSDDYLYGDTVLEDVHKQISKPGEDVDFVYGNVSSPSLGSRYNGEFDREKILVKNICHQSIFYRKTIFNSLGLYNARYKIAADYELNLRCFLSSRFTIKYIDAVIAHYSDGGMSSKDYDQPFLDDFNDILKRIAFSNLDLRESIRWGLKDLRNSVKTIISK